MSVREAATRQYRAIVNRAAGSIGQHKDLPPEGWMATARKALGMPAAQLARRLGVTRARISQAELAEPSGGVTLRTMQATAEALGCRFVYAIVPAEGRVEDVLAAQAHKKARMLVGAASTHMALELQSLPDEKDREQVARIAVELLRTMPGDFWTEK